MSGWIERTAAWCGRGIAAYGRLAARTGRIRWEGLEHVPAEPTIWCAWHGTNLLALALHHTVAPRPTQAFTPPGLIGATMVGWLEGAGFEPVLLPNDGTGNPSAALKSMVRGLSSQGDVVVAVDGPRGPAGRVRPGALWLGRVTGRPLAPVGFAARPAMRMRRWDRRLVPFPGARLAVVIGEPLRVGRSQVIDELCLAEVRDRLDAVSRRAWEVLADSSLEADARRTRSRLAVPAGRPRAATGGAATGPTTDRSSAVKTKTACAP